MPRAKDANLIDGFSSVQAVRHAKGRQHPPRAAQTVPAAAPARPAESRAARLSRTVSPTRHDIHCYQCGYRFVLPGRLERALCPKCRTFLETGDFDIDGPWTRSVKTIGAVRVGPRAEIADVTVVAGRIVLEGDPGRARMQVAQWLELGPGAHPRFERFDVQDVRVRPQAQIRLEEKLTCRDLVVEGELRGCVESAGTTTVRPGGMLQGELRAARLVVEDGAGLVARLQVGCAGSEAGKPQKPARPRPRARR